MAKCRKCGRSQDECGGYLRRVNPVGELPALWECWPTCGAEIPQEEALLAAIEGDPPEKQ